MAISIIDGFLLKNKTTIDKRFVVGPNEFYTNKTSITYKYPGLRVWDLTVGTDGKAFVWNGNQWKSESTDVSVSGTVNYLSKFDTNNSLGDSLLKENNGDIVLENGNIDIKNGKIIGNGLELFNLNANELKNGKLPLDIIKAPSNKIIVTNGNNQASSFQSLDDITIETSNHIKIQGTPNPDEYKILLSKNVSQSESVYRNNALNYNTSSGYLSTPALKLKSNNMSILRNDFNDSSKILIKNSNNEVKSLNNPGLTPIGGIIMWSGSTIPNGWTLCDGNNGSPNLMDKFIVGRGNNYNNGDSGGFTDPTLPQHNHNISDHNHSYKDTLFSVNDSNSSGINHIDNIESVNKGSGNKRISNTQTPQNSVYSYNIDRNTEKQSLIVSSSGTNNTTNKNLPPYYALAFIMYIGEN